MTIIEKEKRLDVFLYRLSPASSLLILHQLPQEIKVLMKHIQRLEKTVSYSVEPLMQQKEDVSVDLLLYYKKLYPCDKRKKEIPRILTVNESLYSRESHLKDRNVAKLNHQAQLSSLSVNIKNK